MERGRGRSAGLTIKKAMKKSSCSFDFGSFIMVAAVDGKKIVMLSPSDEENQLLKLKTLVLPPKYEFKEMVGSCNGLVCLHDEDLKEVCLWNPSTGEHKILPKPKKFGLDWTNSLAAFGFDLETKDYKVLLITGPKGLHYRPVAPIECLCQVQVYSLSTDSWRLLGGIISLPGDIFSCLDDVLYLNGSCFFLSSFLHNRKQTCFPEGDRFVISFDFTKEIFNPIQLPDHHRDNELYLRSLGDKIALFTKSYHNACEDFNIWLLNEHGCNSNNSIVTKESWEKLHFFQIKHELHCESNLPIGLSNDGQFALLQTSASTAVPEKVKLYHLLSKEVKQKFLSSGVLLSKAHAYKPSLVAIIGGNGATNL